MRYLSLAPPERQAMLKQIGVAAQDDFFAAIPASARLDSVSLPAPLDCHSAGEIEVEKMFAKLAEENRPASEGHFFAGAGAYRHHIPASVDHLIQRSEFMTAYTPYQPEIAQGTLQMLFEFQTQIARLTGMDIANASMYEGASSCAEALLMTMRITKRKRAILSSRLHPHYAASCETLGGFAGKEITSVEHRAGQFAPLIEAIDDETACVIIQNPDFFGDLADFTTLAEQAHAKGVLVIAVVNEIISLGAVKPPGEMGADIVAAEGQSLGNPLGFGGPYVGLLAAKQPFLRQMPGRLAGRTSDAYGREGYVLTLAAREQHIRRERATSNICTNSGLCALAFTCHLALLGGAGLKRLAELNHARACQLAERLEAIPNVACLTPHFFNEFALQTPLAADALLEKLSARNIIGGVPVSRLLLERKEYENWLLVAASELTSDDDINAYASALADIIKEAKP